MVAASLVCLSACQSVHLSLLSFFLLVEFVWHILKVTRQRAPPSPCLHCDPRYEGQQRLVIFQVNTRGGLSCVTLA